MRALPLQLIFKVKKKSKPPLNAKRDKVWHQEVWYGKNSYIIERENLYVWERERQRERGRVCLCKCVISIFSTVSEQIRCGNRTVKCLLGLNLSYSLISCATLSDTVFQDVLLWPIEMLTNYFVWFQERKTLLINLAQCFYTAVVIW
jgi:hypothetical protein